MISFPACPGNTWVEEKSTSSINICFHVPTQGWQTIRFSQTCTKTTKYQNPPRTTNKQKTKTKKWNSKAPWKGELQGAVSWQCHVASSLISPFSKALFISEVKKHSIWGSTEGCQAGCWQLFYFISQFYDWKMRWQTQWSSCLDGLGLR